MTQNSEAPEIESSRKLDKKKYGEDIEDSKRVEGIIDKVSKKVEDVLSNKFVKKGVYRILDTVDENYMETMRSLWAKAPDEFKWAVVYLPAIFKANPALLHLMPLHLLARCGLLEYPEKSLKNSASLEKKAVKYGIKIGKLFKPELAALEPLIAPIQKVLDLEEKFFADMRAHLSTKKGGRGSGATRNGKAVSIGDGKSTRDDDDRFNVNA